MTTGLKEAILEFFSWESLGAGSAGSSPTGGLEFFSWEEPRQAPMPGRFAETVGLDDSFEKKKSWEESRPWQGSDAGQARPGGRNVAR